MLAEFDSAYIYLILVVLPFAIGILLCFMLFKLLKCGGFLFMMVGCALIVCFSGINLCANIFAKLPIDDRIKMFIYDMLCYTPGLFMTIGMVWCILRLRRIKTAEFKPAKPDETNY